MYQVAEPAAVLQLIAGVVKAFGGSCQRASRPVGIPQPTLTRLLIRLRTQKEPRLYESTVRRLCAVLSPKDARRFMQALHDPAAPAPKAFPWFQEIRWRELHTQHAREIRALRLWMATNMGSDFKEFCAWMAARHVPRARQGLAFFYAAAMPGGLEELAWDDPPLAQQRAYIRRGIAREKIRLSALPAGMLATRRARELRRARTHPLPADASAWLTIDRAQRMAAEFSHAPRSVGLPRPRRTP